MHSAVVIVKGTQTDELGEVNSIELTSIAKVSQKNEVTYVSYNESQLTGMEDTTTLLKIFADSVVLVRMGKIEQRQEFKIGVHTSSTYITPYGSLNMSVMTTKLDINLQANTITLSICYKLFIDNNWQSDNRLSIVIQEDKR